LRFAGFSILGGAVQGQCDTSEEACLQYTSSVHKPDWRTLFSYSPLVRHVDLRAGVWVVESYSRYFDATALHADHVDQEKVHALQDNFDGKSKAEKKSDESPRIVVRDLTDGRLLHSLDVGHITELRYSRHEHCRKLFALSVVLPEGVDPATASADQVEPVCVLQCLLSVACFTLC
jgi:hypothetical protein